jgi:predicted glycoside hydrolase/deacetylase ChbG (UPF0249 family)
VDRAKRKGFLIINADDFGLSTSVNRAIVASLQASLCSSTTIMANQPAFLEACQLAHDHRLFDRVGVHLVLTEGSPLTEAIKRFPRFCDPEGQFCLSRKKRVLRMSVAERDAVAGELSAQIRRCKTAGLPITHVDSHNHSHEEFAILSLVIDLAHREKIRFCRLSKNCGSGIDLPRTLYRHVVNARIRHAGLAGTRFFGRAGDVAELMRKRGDGCSAEVMVHPAFDEHGSLHDSFQRVGLDDLVSQIPRYREAISYGSLPLPPSGRQ